MSDLYKGMIACLSLCMSIANILLALWYLFISVGFIGYPYDWLFLFPLSFSAIMFLFGWINLSILVRWFQLAKENRELKMDGK